MRSQRGAEGGYWLARTRNEVTIGEVIRAMDGPLAYDGAAASLQTVWIGAVRRLTERPDAWSRR